MTAAAIAPVAGGPLCAHRQVPVRLGGRRDYVVHVRAGLLRDGAGELCAPHAGRAVIITQPVIARRYAATVVDALGAAGIAASVETFPAGERFKTLATVARLYRALYDARADRKTRIIALGGGVVGDVAGFVAATYARGLPLVQIPTTLLAMVDSSVGGKTGVDFAQGKNLIGAFYQPRAVLVDPDVLATLPAREVRSGLAEVVKYGAIRDPALLDFLRPPLDGEAFATIIERSCQIKAKVVERDEREETGARAVLNFGHTVGHALEAATDYRRFRHGEAVAVGMVAAACIGEVAGITRGEARTRLVDTLRSLGLPVALPAALDVEAILGLLSLDKKAEAGRVRWVLLRALGDVAPPTLLKDEVVRAGLALQAQAYGASGGVG